MRNLLLNLGWILVLGFFLVGPASFSWYLFLFAMKGCSQ